MSTITEIGKSVRSHLVGEQTRSGADQSEPAVDVSEALSAATATEKRRSRRSFGQGKQLGLRESKEAGSAGRVSSDVDMACTGVQQKLSKHEIVLSLLRQHDGATIDELMEATAWQAHSVRGFLSGTVRKKLALNLISDVVGNGVRRYRVEAGDNVNVPAQADRSLQTNSPSEQVVSDGAASDQAV